MTFSEANTVQKWLVERLVELGWEYVPGEKLARERTDVLVEDTLIERLEILNDRLHGFPERVDEVLPEIRARVLAGATDGLVPANESMTTLLRGDHTVKYVGLDDYVPLRLIDFESLGENDFVVSDEVTFGPPGKERRYDIVLWVNGIPLVVVETKTPVNSSVSWLNGARDIANVYAVEGPTFFVPNVLVAATDGKEFHYGAAGQPGEHWLMWGSTQDPYYLDGTPRVRRSVELLLTPARVLSILRDFTLFEATPDGGKRKLIPRYPQVEAAEAIHKRVLDGGQKGLIWHYQGTGKTLLMGFAALMLLNDDAVGGPTILVVLDRLDLVEQVERQFRTVGLPRLTVAGTKADLSKALKDDKRGIVVTTIFRFEDAGVLNERDNIVVMVDEAHRTQEGQLGDLMRAALPNARFFGLTGTPISDKDRNTFKLFGDETDPGYVLNSYSMERSIVDGASVPVHVETRLVNWHLDKNALDEAFDEFADEEDLTDEERDVLAGRAAHVKTLLLNPDRVTAVCGDILDHFEKKIAPLGMKGQVVAYDRELVVMYETELNRLITERGLSYTTAVVMTAGGKDDPTDWAKYELTRQQEADIKARFNKPDTGPTLLIVTAKLLTGFDAPIEQVMYLDKPLRRHTLFQAITRTNRRYTNPVTGQEKRNGLIVDYIGVGNQIAQALKAADPEAGGKRPVDVDTLAAEFTTKIDACLARFAGINRDDHTYEALSAALERVKTSEDRDAYAREFTGVQTLWEFLAPHDALTPYEDDYKWLAQIYEASRPSKVSDALLWHRLGAKTLALVHGHITDVAVTGTGLEEVIVDPDSIDALRKLAAQGELDLDPDRDYAQTPITLDEVLDTIDARIRRRLDATGGHTVYATLAEQIEKLRQQAIQSATDSIEFLKKALEVAKTAVKAERLEVDGKLDQAAHLLDPNIGALTQIVNEYKPASTPVVVDDVVRDIDTIVKQVSYSGWAENQSGDRTVRKELRTVLAKYSLPLTGDLFDHAYAYVRENY
ncbi:MAG: type I restriction endonuclease subunit R [Brooklawnia sp.]|jgi:type I restriction enzyme R subunit